MASPRLLIGRVSQVGAVYAVTAVVHGRRDRLRGDIAQTVADELRRAGSDDAAQESLAWVVMPDHVHWLLRLRAGTLSTSVRSFKSRSARMVNLTAGSEGALWQPGFYDHRLRSNDDLSVQARYILANPVRAGLVGAISEWPHAWCRWSLV